MVTVAHDGYVASWRALQRVASDRLGLEWRTQPSYSQLAYCGPNVAAQRSAYTIGYSIRLRATIMACARFADGL